MMTAAQILFLVQIETRVPLSAMIAAKLGEALNAKYVAILMMHEDGYKPGEIARHMRYAQASVYTALKRIDLLLNESGKTEFKKMYLACIKRMAEMEEAA